MKRFHKNISRRCFHTYISGALNGLHGARTQASGSAIKKKFSISYNSSHILPTFGLPAIPTVPLFGGAQMAERRTTDQHYIIWAAWLLLQRGFPVRVLETCPFVIHKFLCALFCHFL